MIQKVAFNSNFVKKCRKPISAPSVKSAHIFTRRRKPMKSKNPVIDFAKMVLITGAAIATIIFLGC